MGHSVVDTTLYVWNVIKNRKTEFSKTDEGLCEWAACTREPERSCSIHVNHLQQTQLSTPTPQSSVSPNTIQPSNNNKSVYAHTHIYIMYAHSELRLIAGLIWLYKVNRLHREKHSGKNDRKIIRWNRFILGWALITCIQSSLQCPQLGSVDAMCLFLSSPLSLFLFSQFQLPSIRLLR